MSVLRETSLNAPWARYFRFVSPATPAGVGRTLCSMTGGVATLDHRLMAWNPAGSWGEVSSHLCLGGLHHSTENRECRSSASSIG